MYVCTYINRPSVEPTSYFLLLNIWISPSQLKVLKKFYIWKLENYLSPDNHKHQSAHLLLLITSDFTALAWLHTYRLAMMSTWTQYWPRRSGHVRTMVSTGNARTMGSNIRLDTMAEFPQETTRLLADSARIAGETEEIGITIVHTHLWGEHHITRCRTCSHISIPH